MPRFWSPGQALFTRARLHLSCLDGKIPGSCAIEMDSSTWEKHFEFENPCDRFFFKLWNRFFLQRYFPGWYLVIGLILEKVYIMFQEWEKFHPKNHRKGKPARCKKPKGVMFHCKLHRSEGFLSPHSLWRWRYWDQVSRLPDNLVIPCLFKVYSVNLGFTKKWKCIL